MIGAKFNAAVNILQGVLSYNRDRQTHANDIAQQQVNNELVRQREELALNSLATSSALQRRQLTFEFLQQQKELLHKQGSAAVQAAWAGIEGGTANDILVSVLQEQAQAEVARDEGLRAIHDETTGRASQIVLNTVADTDYRNFSKPDALAAILGIGKDILDDNRRAGRIN